LTKYFFDTQKFDFTENRSFLANEFNFLDWDMVLENEVESTNEEPVDIVVRQQPSKVEPGAFYRNTRRMIVHQVQGVDVVKPSCGNCCILQ